MKTYKETGVYGEGDVYVLETLEDWDDYEKICKEQDTGFINWNPNFYAFKKEFESYIGKIWEDKNQLRYTYNGNPVYVEYKVIGIEDNYAQMDWYWVVKNTKDENDIKYILANSWDLFNGLKK